MNLKTTALNAAILLCGMSAVNAMPTTVTVDVGGDMATLVVPVSQRASCRSMGRMRSIESRASVTVTFRNRSGAFRSVNWVDFDGQLVQYAALNPGESYSVQTFLTHPWVFTDGPGNCIETFLPERGRTTFSLQKRNRGSGGD